MAESKPRTRTAAKKPASTSKQRRSSGKAAADGGGERRQSARTPERKRAKPKPASPRVAVQEFPLPPDVEQHYGRERLDFIRARIPEDAQPADFLRLLLEGIRLHSDPLRGDVYLTRGFARDGGDTEYAVAAKRDTLLAYAERHADFRGFDAGAIYKDDTFHAGDPDGEAITLRARAGISHGHGLPGHRGELVGAWAAVEREGRPPYVFVAACEEYLPDLDALDPEDPRRVYPDRYMVKAAMCWPLRMAYNLTDVVGAEELHGAALPTRERQPGQAPAPDVGPLEGRELDETDRRILDLFAEAQRYAPETWTRAKVRALALEGTDAQREALAAEMEASIAPHRPPEAVADREQLERRLAELEAFDYTDLDAEALTEYRAEVARVRDRLRAVTA